MGKRFENLEEAMCSELEMLNKKYGSETAEMSEQDVKKADLLYHALKSAETYHAMKDADEWEDEMDARSGRMGRSYRRGRDSIGRYTSRDMGDGYSGHYPDWTHPYYPR